MNAVTAFDLKENECKFPRLQFGCPLIDRTIGHILSSGITELSGEAGVGKSQVCMHLALRCQLSPEMGGCDGTAAYMSCGEGEFPIRRLSQMAAAMTETLQKSDPASGPLLLERVFIEEIPTHEHLRDSLEKKLPDMCRDQNLKLLIIDSIAGALRSEFNVSKSSEMSDRTQYLFKLATHLKWLADTFRISVLLVNQVTERFEDNCSPIDLCGFNGGENFGWNVYQPGYNSTIPALGLAWSHCVNTRIMLFKGSGAQTRTLVDAPEATENGNGQSVPPSQNPSADAHQLLPRRVMQLQFSPRFPTPAICRYVVTQAGISDC